MVSDERKATYMERFGTIVDANEILFTFGGNYLTHGFGATGLTGIWAATKSQLLFTGKA